MLINKLQVSYANKKGIKIPKSGHKYATSRCFNKFDSILFLRDLDQSNLMDVFNKTEPEEARNKWMDMQPKFLESFKNKEGMDNTENNLEKNIKNKINEIYE